MTAPFPVPTANPAPVAGAGPSVTVLMTMYQAEKDLRASLDSVLAQTWRDFEFLILDDGSRDRSVEIVRAYRDPRIRLVANPVNQGQTACLNQGLSLARGEWIARQDADDLSHPDRLQLQMELARQRPELALVGAQAWLADPAGRFAGLLNVPCGPESLSWAMLWENPVVHTAALFRRDAALELGGYDAAYTICQDYDLWERIVRRHPAANLARRLVTYRCSPDSLQHRGRDRARDEVERVLERVLRRLLPGQPLGAEERELLWAFRTGALGGRVDAFRDLYTRFWTLYAGLNPGVAALEDFRRTRALHGAKLARDLCGVGAWKGAMAACRALALHPGAILSLAADRISGPFVFSR
jgi:glycosyltransferase involved in cell wall biosynthesis